MQNGYKIFWTDNALTELKRTIDYLESNFSDKELRKLATEIERTIVLISNNPSIFPELELLQSRKAIVLKFNSLHYRITEDTIEILSFLSNRLHPDRVKK